MPRPRYENLDPDKKTKLMDAATVEFATQGYELASINRILETAGISKGAFYYYFDDKADLASAVFTAIATPMLSMNALQTPRSAEHFWTELREMSMQRLRHLESKRTEYECVIRISAAVVKDPSLAGRITPNFLENNKRIETFLAEGVAIGALRSDLPISTLMSLMEAVKLAAYRASFKQDHVPTDPEMDAFNELVIDLCQRVTSPKEG